MKRFSMLAITMTMFLAFGAAAFAAPVAQVKAFPNGEGLEEFLSGIDSSKISRAGRGEFDDTAVLVVPLLKECSIEVYVAEWDENHGVVPKRDNKIAEGDFDRGLLFWCSVPEGIPAVMVILSAIKEYYWSPSVSGFDGSLVTNDEFVPFAESGEAAVKSNLVKLTIAGQEVNLRAKPDTGGSVIRKASSPEFFIGEEATVKDSSGDEWRKIVYSVNEINDCLHEVEIYVSAKFSATEGLDSQTTQKASYYEAAKSAFGAFGKWEDVFAPMGETFGTMAWTDAKVYTEPNPGSSVAGIMPKSPEGRDAVNSDVHISGWRTYEGQDPERIGPFDIWWRTEWPITGWVEGHALGVMNSGLLTGF